ncbi:tyrosine-protein phosphatase [Poseidonocella sedimentorum]|uniref:Tyrosine phosphatase family protein n=1 Tax=Poseidonocella sedimentorum TaxID=871652 RepID=A0A1I6EAT1_9RHOB|nr:tyrosine-protein phosphatase [Poseidonocella sedimentorum]SFR14814.1 Tyrosine phosphatase family protein [Poseidonocella sedimentorum]
MGLWAKFSAWERKQTKRLTNSFGKDISTAAGRRAARFHVHWIDHGILRYPWTNFDKIADGVYRSNQPGHARLQRMKDMGIRTILNLRGEDEFAHYLFEKESCDALGLDMIDISLHARKARRGERYLEVIEALRSAPRPMLIHCKSGADRAGFAAVLYKLAVEGAPISEARKQLGLRYLHIRWSKTGILDHILDLYEARNAQSPIAIEDWFRTEYRRKEAQRSFDALPIWKR